MVNWPGYWEKTDATSKISYTSTDYNERANTSKFGVRRTWWFINILKFDDYCAVNIIANLHQLFYWNTGVILQHQYKTNYKESDSWVFASLRPLIIVNRWNWWLHYVYCVYNLNAIRAIKTCWLYAKLTETVREDRKMMQR